MLIKDLNVSYNDKWEIRDINFKLYKGDILGIIGANGSGKSTIIKVIAGIIDNYKGVFHNTHSTGYVPQNIALYDNLSVYENIKIFSSALKLKKDLLEKNIQDILKKLDLVKNINTKIKNLSGGNKRRVNIAVALINEPECLLMDEPEVGIDYKVRKDIEKLITDLSYDNKIIIIASHSKDFLKSCSNKILVLENSTQIYFGDSNDEIFDRL